MGLSRLSGPGKEGSPSRDSISQPEDGAAASAAIGYEEPAPGEVCQDAEEILHEKQRPKLDDFVQIWPLPTDEAANPMPGKVVMTVCQLHSL